VVGIQVLNLVLNASKLDFHEYRIAVPNIHPAAQPDPGEYRTHRESLQENRLPRYFDTGCRISRIYQVDLIDYSTGMSY
jgi:hypothetical protein